MPKHDSPYQSAADRVDLKNPWIAGTLAFFIPGLGHFYQGRVFKGLLYSVCILGTFFYGMKLGEWKIVYHRADMPWRKPTNLGYLAQALVGLPALPAVVQSRRYFSRENQPPNALDQPLSAPFTGMLIRERVGQAPDIETLNGEIRLSTVEGQFGPEVVGKFHGTVDGGEPHTMQVQLRYMEPPILGDPKRILSCHVVEGPEGASEFAGRLMEGSIPREFWNWFQVPLEGQPLERLHGRLGKFYELAVVYTWIAGLLNILAIWDALEGPAYGYGDESPEGTDDQKQRSGGSTSTAGTTRQEPATQDAAAHTAAGTSAPAPDAHALLNANR